MKLCVQHFEWNYCRCKSMYNTLGGTTVDVGVCTTL